MDVHIPTKKTRQGKRFGFVRFANVQNIKVLESQLDAILIGNMKLKANIPLYDKDKQKVDRYNNMGQIETGKQNEVRKGVSFADVVSDSGINGARETRPLNANFSKQCTTGNRENQWSEMEFQVSKEEMSWLNGGLVAKTKSPEQVFHF